MLRARASDEEALIESGALDLIIAVMRHGLLGAAILGSVMPIHAAAEEAVVSPAPAEVPTGIDVDALVRRASALGLAGERYWHLLLHYRARTFGGYESEADGAEFFLATEGKTDPEAELRATITAFADQVHAALYDEAAACRFPARFAWLAERLDFAALGLRAPHCPEYRKWHATLNAGSVSLVFSSAFMNAPASMYGHTLLLLGRKHDPDNKLLANILNFAAYPTTDDPILYTLLGLAGGFPGRFAAMPYYVKVQEYSNFESRDLWEYRLAFSQEQIERLLMHAWELDHTYFDYYFLDENCSYHLLSLLEIADPRLHLTERFPLYTIPTDTLRVVLEQEGMVVSRDFRPSHRRMMNERRALLGSEEIDVAERLVEDDELHLELLDGLAAERAARVLEAAHDYFKYEHGFDPGRDHEREAAVRKREFQLLAALGKLGVKTTPPEPQVPLPPEVGHDTARFSVGAGWTRGGRPFQEIGLRTSLHDPLDLQDGYVTSSQVEMPALRLRVNPTLFERNARAGVVVERLDLIRITSLMPKDGWVLLPSWRVTLGGGRVRDLSCHGWRCQAAEIGGGGGYALSSQLIGGETYYVFADLLAQAGPVFLPNYRIGGAAAAGLMLQLASFWRVHAEARYRYSALGDTRAGRGFFEADVGTNFVLHRNVALRATAAWAREQGEALASVLIYF